MKELLYGSALLAALLLVGCGSNDKADGSVIANGEATMSIELEGELKLDKTRGCQKLFVVHAVDGNGNPIPNLGVDANVIVDAKVVANGTGTIQTTAPITLVDGAHNFSMSNVRLGDKLIILPSSGRFNSSYLGDWEIYGVDGNTLTLKGAAYNLETTDRISYVVGDESVYVPGYGTGIAHIEQPESNTTAKVTTDNGYAYFDLIYDLSLIGHSVVVGAHSGDGYRMGAAVSGVLPDCTASSDTNNDTNNSAPVPN